MTAKKKEKVLLGKNEISLSVRVAQRRKAVHLQSTLGKEGREELLQDGVADVLHLGAHSDSLSLDVHGPDPYCCSPGGLVEQNEEE